MTHWVLEASTPAGIVRGLCPGTALGRCAQGDTGAAARSNGRSNRS